ncbi:MAG: sulfotransferase [Anaerolineales bacterium]|nr:sulfotransferase [Anaerolineales bacterium]
MNEDLTIFFCIGVQKSGTTILARILDQHPDIACMWESYAFKPRLKASIFHPESDSWRKHGFAEADVRRWSARWGGRPGAALRRLVRRVTGTDYVGMIQFRHTMSPALADFARRCNATVVGDKWPWYIDYLEETMQAFPNARFIYNVRDPRGIWNSAQRFKQRERGDEILQEMLQRDRFIAPYLSRPNFLTLRYRDLIRQPEKTARRLYEFLGCEFDPAYLVYDPAQDPYPQRWSWISQASRPLDPWQTEKWRVEVPAETQARLTAESRWFIEKYGYDK